LDEKMTLELLERAWMEIGRFTWAFTNVEMVLDQVLIVLFSLKFPTEDLFLNNIDLRKKINIAGVALSHQNSNSDHKKLLKDFHTMHDLRNKIAHKVFLAEKSGEKSGIRFSWSTVKSRIGYQSEFHSFEDFEKYFVTLRAISDALTEIGKSCKPLAGDDIALASTLHEIGLSNVIDFPERR
jgi:hypothetical protein